MAAVRSMAGTEDDPRHVAALAVAQPLQQGPRVDELLSRAAAVGTSDPAALSLLGMAAFAVGDQLRAAELDPQRVHGLVVGELDRPLHPGQVAVVQAALLSAAPR